MKCEEKHAKEYDVSKMIGKVSDRSRISIIRRHHISRLNKERV